MHVGGDIEIEGRPVRKMSTEKELYPTIRDLTSRSYASAPIGMEAMFESQALRTYDRLPG